MTEVKSAHRRRIVITLDTARIETRELERLTHLALRIDAELEGVFVEDSDLFRMAELTFLQEFRPTSRRTERIESARMEQELRAVARQAERALAKYAEHCGVPWSFRIWRGSIERELLTGLEADVLALMRLGEVAMQPARRRPREVIAAYFDGSEGAGKALETAADLAADSDQLSLQVLLAPGPDTNAADLRKRAEEMLGGYIGRTQYHSLVDDGLPELVRVLHEADSSALVMHRGSPLLGSTSLRQNLAQLGCPLFLVR